MYAVVNVGELRPSEIYAVLEVAKHMKNATQSVRRKISAKYMCIFNQTNDELHMYGCLSIGTICGRERQKFAMIKT